MSTKLASLALASVAAIALGFAPGASAKSCGNVNVELGHGSEGGAQNISATNISCGEARKVARRCVNGSKRSNWTVRLTSGDTRFILKSGKRRVSYAPAGGGGCASVMEH